MGRGTSRADEEQVAEDDAADAGRDVDPQEVVRDDLRRGQKVDTAGCGDEALDNPEDWVPHGEGWVDLLQHRVHQQADADDSQAGNAISATPTVIGARSGLPSTNAWIKDVPNMAVTI